MALNEIKKNKHAKLYMVKQEKPQTSSLYE